MMNVSDANNQLGFITSPGVENGLGNYKDMSDKRAGQLMVEYFNKTDTAALGGKADGKVSDGDLKKIVRDEAQPMEYRQAALKFLKDDALRNQAHQDGDKGKYFTLNEFSKIAESNQTLGNDGREALGTSSSPVQTPFDRVSQGPIPTQSTPFDRISQGPIPTQSTPFDRVSQDPIPTQSTPFDRVRPEQNQNTENSQSAENAQGSESSTNNFLVKLLMLLLPMLLMNK